jgi:hypothetical protein
MRDKRIQYLSGAVILLIGLTVCTSLMLRKSHGQSISEMDGLMLEVKPSKENYLPGELITIKFKVVNKSSESLSLYKGSTVRDGYLTVLVADDNGSFKQYLGPGWGTKDADYNEPLTLEPGQAFETEATVLWNQKLETGHLNRAYAENLETRIPTDYAFPTPGVYYIKAVLNSPLSKKHIESAPVRLALETPQGADLEVWNRIKDDGQYALFIQTGGLAERLTGATTKEIAESLEALLQRYPDNHYSEQIRTSLNHRRSAIERRQK